MKKLRIEAKSLNTNDLIEVLAEIIKKIIRAIEMAAIAGNTALAIILAYSMIKMRKTVIPDSREVSRA